MKESELREGKVKIVAVVDRIEGDQEGRRLAVLCLGDGQELIIPFDRLPPGVAEGVALKITITPDVGETEARRSTVQGLRKKLLSTKDQNNADA